MRAREGDLIKTKSNVVFDVKGLVHPAGKIIAFPRFIPSPQGTRQGKDGLTAKSTALATDSSTCRKITLTSSFLTLCLAKQCVKFQLQQVAEHYKPEEKLWALRSAKDLTVLESKALHLAETLKAEAGIPWSSIGISGSIMAGLTTEKSDIDPLVYGVENCRKAYAALQRLLKDRFRIQALHTSGAAGAVRFPFEGYPDELRRLRSGRKPKSVPRQIHGNRLLHPLREGLERNNRAIWGRVLQKQRLRKNNSQNS